MSQGDFPTEAERSPAQTFLEMTRCWRAESLDEMFAYIHPEAVHEVNIDGMTVPQLGPAHGETAMRARFQYVMETFEMLDLDIETLRVDGDIIHSSIAFTYRHRRTGEEITSNVRVLATSHDGRFVRFQEFADAAFITAFLRLTGEI